MILLGSEVNYLSVQESQNLSIFTMFYGVISLYKMSREKLYNTKIKKKKKKNKINK